MKMIVLLLCIGVCVGQTPANTYLSLISSSYLSSDARMQGHRLSDSIQPESRPETIQPNGPSDGVQENSNRTTQDINAAISASEVDRNGPSDGQPDYHGGLVPQSRLLAAARSQGIPPSLFIPGPAPVLPYSNVPSSPLGLDGVSPYGYVLSHQNLGSPFLRANSRSHSDEVQPNQHYSLSLLSQAPAESRLALLQNQQPNLRFGIDQSVRSSLLNAAPTSRTSLNGYFPIDEPQPTGQQSNQNGYIQQQVTQESLNPANYRFSYGVNAVEKGRSVQFAHEEQRVLDQAAGAYSVLLPDGQRQVVEYTADQGGYRPRVSYANDVGQSPSYANDADQSPSYANAVGQSPSVGSPLYTQDVGHSPSYANDVERNPFVGSPSYANDNGQSPFIGNTGLETDVSGNYGSPVIAARAYQTRGRQRISIDNRRQPQDGRTSPPTRHY